MSEPHKETMTTRKRKGDKKDDAPKKQLISSSDQLVSSLDPSNLCVATASTASKLEIINFPQSLQTSVVSRDPSVLSLASDHSKYEPLFFQQEPKGLPKAVVSRDPSVLSLASDHSKYEPLFFQEEPKGLQKAVVLTDPGVLSLASDHSKYEPLFFQQEPKGIQGPFCCVCEKTFDDRPVYFACRHVACTPCVIKGTELETDQFYCTVCGTNQRIVPDPALKLPTGHRHILNTIQKHKKEMHSKFSMTREGNGDERSPLNHIYTSLSMNFGKRDISEEPHLRPMFQRKTSKKHEVNLSGLFESSAEFLRTVLTNGAAGIGKSFSVQKFIVDWAEGTSNKDVHFIFSLSFRELNLIKENMSLLQLLKVFHPVVSDLNPQDLDQTKVILILDGFDESRFHLDFSKTQRVSSVEEPASVPSLIINLINGNLLPKAQLWITSRPAASYQIPGQFIHKVTEIQGFNDQQKNEYFKKRFSKKADVAKMVISHIQSSQTLDVLCQIPIFCWMTSVLLEEIFGGEEQTEAPQTLTEMMGTFIFVQTKRSSRKYDQDPKRERTELLKAKREFLLKLGKLAFTHLHNNSLIFYEKDLQECGLDPEEATVNSGFFNSVLREEQLFLHQKVFYFVHLTIQEFFAALYVYDCFTNNKLWASELSSFLGLEPSESSRPPVYDLLKTTVDKVLERNSGHLYFFLRFLLGLLVESNQKCIRGLLAPQELSQETARKMLAHLRAIRRKTISPDACINLFQTMVEMGDSRISEDIQDYLKNKDRARIVLTPLHCSALAFTIQVSKSVLEELDLKSYNTSEEGRRRLIPAVRSSRKANLSECKVSEALLKPLALALSFPHSSLRDLDLTNSDLGDSGVELLSEGLKSPVCKLKILRLSGCLVTVKGCGFLVSALKSNPFHLKELDLSYNHLGTSGETALTDLKNDPQYNLSHLQLNVSHGGSQRMIPGLKKYWCDLSWDTKQAQAGVQFSDDHRGVSRSEETPDPMLVWGGQGLSDHYYWEIEASEPFNIGVAYQSVYESRAIAEKSWSFVCSEEGCYAFHNNKHFPVQSANSSRSSRLAVYLDHSAGVLSFHRVSAESRTLLYTFRREEKFTKDLFPIAELKPKSSVKFYREPEEQKNLRENF